MTTTELVERVKRLDRLYLAMCDAQDRWIADGSLVNFKRWIFYQRRYKALVDAFDVPTAYERTPEEAA